MGRVLTWVGLLLTLTLLVVWPARAELQIHVSSLNPATMEPITLTVTDPRQGEGAGRTVEVTMADGSDRRFVLHLEPGPRPGTWVGRFTPPTPGRYTGTAVLERGDEKEIGLVPVIRVRAVRRPGFLRLSPTGSRTFRFTNGETLFPIGVRLFREDLLGNVDWIAEFHRLRSYSVNFLDVPIPWPGGASEGQLDQAYRAVDTLLGLADRQGRFGVLLRLEGPGRSGQDARYQEEMARATRRWGASPAVACWYIAADTDNLPGLAGHVRALRAADTYHHLIATPAGAVGADGDLDVAPTNWQRPGNRLALLEMSPGASDGALPGEDTWQMLVMGGLGLPLAPYRPGTAEGETLLRRLSALAAVARTVPYHAPGVPLTGVVAADAPGSFCRYGRTWLGWLAPEENRRIRLPVVGRGRYRVRFWDSTTDQPAGTAYVWSPGAGAAVELPPARKTLFLQVEPTTGRGGGPPTGLTATERRRAARAARLAAAAEKRRRHAAMAAANRARRLELAQRAGERKRATRAARARNQAARKAAARAAWAKRLAAKQASARAAWQKRLAAKQASARAAWQKRLAAKQAAARKARERTLAGRRTGAPRETARQKRLSARRAAAERAAQKKRAAEQARQDRLAAAKKKKSRRERQAEARRTKAAEQALRKKQTPAQRRAAARSARQQKAAAAKRAAADRKAAAAKARAGQRSAQRVAARKKAAPVRRTRKPAPTGRKAQRKNRRPA